MSRKRKYSDELRLQVVQDYLDGKYGGFVSISKKYNIDWKAIQHWTNLYLTGGVEALTNAPGTYSGEFKVYAVEYMHQHSLSIRQGAAYFHIPSIPTLAKWERIYYEEGKEALLEERRGWSKKLTSAKKDRPPKKDVNENEDLLAEVQRLRMENDYLKKLNALIQEREKQQQKSK